MVRLASVIVAAMILAAGHSFPQAIYKWKDEKGQWRFSHTPPPGTKTEVIGEEKPNLPEVVVPLEDKEKSGDASLLVQDAGYSFDGQYLDIEGKVKNVGKTLERDVQVGARVWNQNGNLTGSARGETQPKDLKPGETGRFAFRIAAKDSAKISLTTRDSEKTLIVTE